MFLKFSDSSLCEEHLKQTGSDQVQIHASYLHANVPRAPDDRAEMSDRRGITDDVNVSRLL